jgi:hypothetical protein
VVRRLRSDPGKHLHGDEKDDQANQGAEVEPDRTNTRRGKKPSEQTQVRFRDRVQSSLEQGS